MPKKQQKKKQEKLKFCIYLYNSTTNVLHNLACFIALSQI